MIPKRQSQLISDRMRIVLQRRERNTKPVKDYSRKRRWLYAARPDMAVLAHTRSEAIAWFKQQLGVERIDHQAIIGEAI